jgi:stage V sporulation protein SpoVS
MTIIFLGTSGVHHTLIAANIYLKKPVTDLNSIPDFANIDLESSGFPIYVGEDKQGNQVYSLGAGDVEMAKKSIEDLRNILGYSAHDLVVKPVSVKGEKLLALLNHIPASLGSRLWHSLIPALILKSQLKTIYRVIGVK